MRALGAALCLLLLASLYLHHRPDEHHFTYAPSTTRATINQQKEGATP